jgi:NADH-quinone oxidoreductase subunit J
MMDATVFYALASIALVSALVVVAQRSPIVSAFSLIVTLCALSGIYGLLGAPFIAVLQIVVYAGAIMVLFLFVLMLLNVKREAATTRSPRPMIAVAVALGALLVLEIGSVLVSWDGTPRSAEFSASTVAVARVLFGAPYLYVFEATSVLILAALVGAIWLARREP